MDRLPSPDWHGRPDARGQYHGKPADGGCWVNGGLAALVLACVAAIIYYMTR